jgi:hypothetical protein
MAETAEQLIKMLEAEFKLQGTIPNRVRVETLAAAMAAEEIEWGEISITAAVIGFKVAKGVL